MAILTRDSVMLRRVVTPFSQEIGQVSQAADWWPPTVSVLGMIGDGSLSQGGIVSGKVVGEVAKNGSGLNNSSDPVLLWEQARKRFVIYLEH